MVGRAWGMNGRMGLCSSFRVVATGGAWTAAHFLLGMGVIEAASLALGAGALSDGRARASFSTYPFKLGAASGDLCPTACCGRGPRRVRCRATGCYRVTSRCAERSPKTTSGRVPGEAGGEPRTHSLSLYPLC